MSDNKATAREFFAAMNEEGPAVAAARFGADDLVWWTPGGGNVVDQLGGFQAFIDAYFEPPGIVLTVDGMTAEGDRVAVEARSSGDLKNGAKYRNRYHFLLEFRDGRITELREHNDTLHLSQTLGPLMAQATASGDGEIKA